MARKSAWIDGKKIPTMNLNFRALLVTFIAICSADEKISAQLWICPPFWRDDSEKKDTKTLKNQVENNLTSLLDTIENRWLGFYKVLLLGKSNREEFVQEAVNELEDKYFSTKLDFVKSGKKKLLQKILDGYEVLTRC